MDPFELYINEEMVLDEDQTATSRSAQAPASQQKRPSADDSSEPLETDSVEQWSRCEETLLVYLAAYGGVRHKTFSKILKHKTGRDASEAAVRSKLARIRKEDSGTRDRQDAYLWVQRQLSQLQPHEQRILTLDEHTVSLLSSLYGKVRLLIFGNDNY